MIPAAYITEWRGVAPWSQDSQVEQDLIISRALVDIFQSERLAQRLAFRGGTSMYKLYLTPPARYSEDIDLVQTTAEPIGETLDELRAVLDPWLGKSQWKQSEGRVHLVYRFDSEESPPTRMRLKIEINTREHFSELGVVHRPFRVESRWFQGEARISTFALEELLGTKLRALYQRKKGRDLFDLWHASSHGEVDADTMIACFQRYLSEAGQSVTRAQFESNLAEKRRSQAFRTDLDPLLRTGVDWDFDVALDAVLKKLVSKLPGAPWKGEGPIFEATHLGSSLRGLEAGRCRLQSVRPRMGPHLPRPRTR